MKNFGNILLTFYGLCMSANVHPSIALEDKEIKEALAQKNWEKIKMLLRENF